MPAQQPRSGKQPDQVESPQTFPTLDAARFYVACEKGIRQLKRSRRRLEVVAA